jgi:putative nucleotidyltransferase with HDIG domain
MTLMRLDDAIRVLEKEANTSMGNFDNLHRFIGHSYETGKIAGDLAGKLGLYAEELALAGCFHDIGKCFALDKKDFAFHEIIGAEYIKEYGVRMGISDSQKQCDRIAQSFMSHFVVYEQSGMPEYSRWLSGLQKTDSALLLPKSWNELVVIYADLTNYGKRVSFDKRIANIKERDRKSNNPRLKAVEKAEPRLFGIKKDIEHALETKKIDTAQYPTL